MPDSYTIFRCLLLQVVLSLLLVLPAAAKIDKRILLDRDIASFAMSAQMEILEDPQQSYDITAVTLGKQQLKFKPFNAISPNFGNTQSAFWLRTVLHNPYPYAVQLVLEQPLPFLDSIDLYTPDPDRPGEFRVRHAGDRRPFSEREVPHHHFLFNLTLAPGEELPIHIRIASRVTLMAPFTFWFKSAWDQHAENLALISGSFGGMLMVLFLMSLLLTFLLKDPIYPLFALFVLSIAFMTATTHGLSYRYLWPGSPWLAERMQVAGITFVMFSGTLYARVFLGTRKHLPRLDRILYLFLVTLALIIVATFWVDEVKPVAIFSFSVIQFYSPLLLLSGVLCKRKGVPAARFYMLAWTLSLIGSTIASLTMLGIIPYHFALLHATSIGFIFDSVLLALAMADRIIAIRAERDQARKRVHETLVNARSNLESEVERRTRELVVAKREADSANQTKTQFLARMSHELRTPLTSIIGYSELLLGDKSLPLQEHQRRNLRIIHRSGAHLSALINDILDISVIESGKLSVNMTPISFREVLAEVLAAVGSMAGEKSIRLVDTTSENKPYVVVADRVRLRQVVTNLLTNAIKYSPPKSDVWVNLKSREGKVRLSVIDAGPGIASADLEKIFKPFTRLEEMADQVDGIGIGLSITKMLIGLMAGEINVESRVGRGTSFHVDLVETSRAPIAPTDPGHSIPQCDDIHLRAPLRPLVLFIEGNASNRILLETLFRKRTDVELICAENGKTGLLLAKKHLPALILTDIHLPDLSGDEILTLLREDSSTLQVPVIGVSSREGDRAEAELEGFAAVLAKPLNVSRLMEQVDNLLFPAEAKPIP